MGDQEKKKKEKKWQNGGGKLTSPSKEIGSQQHKHPKNPLMYLGKKGE